MNHNKRYVNFPYLLIWLSYNYNLLNLRKMPSLFLSMTLRGSYSNFEVVLEHGTTSNALRMADKLATTINCANRPPGTQIFIIIYMNLKSKMASENFVNFLNHMNIDVKVITSATMLSCQTKLSTFKITF